MPYRLLPALLLCSCAAQAVPFVEFDARALAMGGTGVASASYAAAALFNPALLAVPSLDDTVSFDMPFLGGIVADPGQFVAAAQQLSDRKAVQNLLDVADSFAVQAERLGRLAQNGQAKDAVGELAALNEKARQLAGYSAQAAGDLRQISGKSLRAELGTGTAFAFPNQALAWGVFLNVRAMAAAQVAVEEDDVRLIEQSGRDLQAVTQLFSDQVNAAAQDSQKVVQSWQQLASESGLFSGNRYQLDKGAFQSSGRVVGIGISEVGLSLARQQMIVGQPYYLGVTPKLVRLDVFDYTGRVDELERDRFNASEHLDSRYRLNVDLGLARVWGAQQQWQFGAVIKNLLPQRLHSRSYDSVATRADGSQLRRHYDGQVFTLQPQLRTGVAYRLPRWTLAADLDITRNDGVAFGNASQYLGLGVEYSPSNTAMLRAGYRHDLGALHSGSFTAGFNLAGVQLSLLYNPAQKEAGAGLQFGATW